MDTSTIASVASSMAQQRITDSVDTAVLRKAMDIASTNAQQLIEALPSPAANNPPHLGNSVDVKA